MKETPILVASVPNLDFDQIKKESYARKGVMLHFAIQRVGYFAHYHSSPAYQTSLESRSAGQSIIVSILNCIFGIGLSALPFEFSISIGVGP